MQLITILGTIGNISFFAGVYLLGKKKIYGFYLNILGNLMYLVQAIIMHNPTLLQLSIGLSLVNILGIYEWRKKKVKSTCHGQAELTFYDVKAKVKFTTNKYRIAKKSDRYFAIAKSLKGPYECWRILARRTENVKSNCRCSENKCH